MGKERSSAATSAATASAHDGFKFVGYKNFLRTNPRSDHFPVRRFHHVEFWCSDATNTARSFSWGLGMPLVAKSDLSSGNSAHASYLLRSGHLNFLFTAPYSRSVSNPSSAAIPGFSSSAHHSFTSAHGLGIRAIALHVDSACSAYSAAVSRGAKPSSPPVLLSDYKTAVAEVQLYGDVVLRFVSYGDGDGESEDSMDGYFLPGFEPVSSDELVYPDTDFGIRGLDHAAGNVPNLAETVEYLMKFSGFHEYAEFSGEDVESDLNSVILANNEENVILTVSEPVSVAGVEKRTYLDHNEGAGVQHLGLISEDIFRTLREMRKKSLVGGLEFMPPPPASYYKNLKKRAGDVLTDEQMAECEKMGILVDRDDEGILLQIFTKPVGDRASIFVEIIERIGCMEKEKEGEVYQKATCGGFGKGNITDLLRSLQEYEKTLEPKQVPITTITI